MVELPAALGFWTSWGCGVPVGPGEREHLVLCSCSLWSACYRLALRRPVLRAWVLKIAGSRPIRLSDVGLVIDLEVFLNKSENFYIINL